MPPYINRRRFLAAASASAVPLLPASSAWSQPGTEWRFYRSGTDHPEQIFASRDLAVPAGWRIKADAGGLIPKVYLDPRINYRAVLYDAEGVALATLDPLPVTPMADDAYLLAAPSARIVVSGAVGDGQLHPLSERFSSLAEAQAVFASATSLSESLCGAAIQSAINAAQRGGAAMQGGISVFLPAGRYPLSRPLQLPNNVALEGEGPDRTIIDNQNVSLSTPLVINANPTTARLSLRDLSLHGGTHGIRIAVDDYVVALLVERVAFQLQADKNVECNKLLQMATFRDCTFGLSPFGVYAAAWTSNVVAFDRCSFENHSNAHLYLRGAEGVTVTGGRFEGGGVFAGGQATIDIEDAAAINFVGVYFENTHPVLLRERRSRNAVRFDGCHFTGTTGPTGPMSYRFDSDGIVTFGTNDWGLVTQGPAKTALCGVNDRLITNGQLYLVRSATQHHIRSGQIEITELGSRDLLTVQPSGNPTQPMTLAGTLALTISPSEAGAAATTTYRYTVHARTAGQMVTINVAADNAGAPRLAVHSNSGRGASVSLELGALSLPVLLSWAFEGAASGIGQEARLLVDLA